MTLSLASSDVDPVGPSCSDRCSTTITLSNDLLVNSFKTLDACGVDVHIARGACLTLQYVILHIHHCIPTDNALVRSSPTHSGFRSLVDGDAISIYASTDVWIDHCTLHRCVDGLVDAIMGSTRITVSNSHFFHHDDVMLLGHNDDFLPGSHMQVTLAFNCFGPALLQHMPRCRRGYVHVVNNHYVGWGMYVVGDSRGPTVNNQENMYAASADPNAKEVTKKEAEGDEDWSEWNWRTEGDVMVNNAFFVSSGEGMEAKYVMAESVAVKAAAMFGQLTMNVGAIGR